MYNIQSSNRTANSVAVLRVGSYDYPEVAYKTTVSAFNGQIAVATDTNQP